MLETLYRSTMLLGAPFAAAALLTTARGRARIGERFGRWGSMPENPLWFHGASFGEVNGLLPLIKHVKSQAPEIPLLLSATSVTGLEVGEKFVDAARLLPFDHRAWIRRALGSCTPRGIIFSETELWPGLLDELLARRVPACLVNARISDRAYPRYRAMGAWLRPRLHHLDCVCASSELAKERFLSLGVRPERISVTGNAKYDAPPRITTPEALAKLRREFFGDDRPVLVLGSLRPGEEEVWFPVLREACASPAALGVVIAPRHKEKFDFFAEELRKAGIPFARRSALSSARSQAPQHAPGLAAILLDTLGELASVYALAAGAFVGGTLRDYGGHNPLEPAPYGAPVSVGPYSQNAADVVQLLRDARGVVEFTGADGARAFLEAVRSADPELAELGQRGKALWSSLQGATARIMSAAETAIGPERLWAGRVP